MVRLTTMHFRASHTRRTGIPRIGEFSSSIAPEFTVSLALQKREREDRQTTSYFAFFFKKKGRTYQGD